LGNILAASTPRETRQKLGRIAVFDPNASASANDRSYCKRGGYIEEFARFDPAQFGIMPGSIDGSDPDHFLALRVAARPRRQRL